LEFWERSRGENMWWGLLRGSLGFDVWKIGWARLRYAYIMSYHDTVLLYFATLT
jgi:hypothetical protein